MWFNNVLIYNYEYDASGNLADLLAEDHLKPCPPHARFTYGWLPVMGEFAHEVAGVSLICMGKEERLLPRSVVHRILEERIQSLETQRGYAVKRAEKGQMTEDLEFELLPKAFCLQKRTFAFLDEISHRLVINASSATQASQLTSLLRKSVPGLHIEPIPVMDNLSTRIATWMTHPESLPANFQLASDCLLFSPNDEKKRFTCKGYELPAEEVLTLLSQGLVVAEISLIWNERIQFTLTDDLTFKKLKCMDYLVDDFNEIRELDDDHAEQDAALALLSGELRALVNDLQSNIAPTIINADAAPVIEHAVAATCPF